MSKKMHYGLDLDVSYLEMHTKTHNTNLYKNEV